LVSEIIALEESRDGLRADHGILERHLEEQRLRLRSSIGDLQRLLDDPGRLRVASAPSLRGATRPPFLDEELAAGATDDDATEADAEPEVIDLGSDESKASEPAPSALAGPERLDVPSEPRPSGGVTFTAPDEGGPSPASPASRLAVKDREAEAWARFADVAPDGPPTQPITLATDDDDVYLAELRKAMLEDTSPGGSATDHDDEGSASRPRARFGRRR
jgi:hypothetical protein